MKPIHEDIPTERAWQVGRRIYVRCGYQSQLNVDLRRAGAKWDPDVKALWVGSGKRDQVLPLVIAAQDRAGAAEAVKVQGRWVRIPYEATDIRARAKALGGKWDGPTKCWAMPSEEAQAEINRLINARAEKAKADKQARRDAERGAAQGEQRATREQTLTDSGRTPTGDTEQLRQVSTRRMNRAGALQKARPVGSVVALGDGRRGVVVDVKVWFTGGEMASSTCWHPETHDMAHWDILHTVAVVEPTAEELAADAEREAVQQDAAELHELMEHAGELTGATRDGSQTAIPAEEIAATITVTYGTTSQYGGRLVLTTDGRVVWQHPGFYDDYIRAEGSTTEAAVVERVRALTARGRRSRSATGGQMDYYYEVKVTDGK